MFIGKRTNGNYFIEYFDHKTNSIRRISTGTKSRNLAIKFQSRLSQNLEIEEPDNGYKISEFRDEYLKFAKTLFAPSYYRSTELSFKQFINYLGKDISIKKIDTRLVQEFITIKSAKANQAARMYLRTLKAAFNRAIDWEYIERNPFCKIKVSKPLKVMPIFLSEYDFQKIVDLTNRYSLRELFTVAFYTGMRLGEIVNLRWEDVNLEDRIIVVKNTSTFMTKNKKDRIIPISKKLLEIFYSLKNKIIDSNHGVYVFLGPRRLKFNSDYVTKKFKDSVKLSTINQEVHFHTLRHSFASNLVQRGVSLYVVKELLGHEDIKTTQIYAHLQRENLFTAVDML
jgi:site-specific recombinase XerD